MSALVSGNWLRNNWLENMFREVLDAKWDQIDFGQRSWRIPKTKSGKVRHVPLSEHALQTLASVRKIYGPMHLSKYLQTQKQGFQSFPFLWGGMLPESAQGCRLPEFTTRYAHLSRERLLEAVECIPNVP